MSYLNQRCKGIWVITITALLHCVIICEPIGWFLWLTEETCPELLSLVFICLHLWFKSTEYYEFSCTHNHGLVIWTLMRKGQGVTDVIRIPLLGTMNVTSHHLVNKTRVLEDSTWWGYISGWSVTVLRAVRRQRNTKSCHCSSLTSSSLLVV